MKTISHSISILTGESHLQSHNPSGQCHGLRALAETNFWSLCRNFVFYNTSMGIYILSVLPANHMSGKNWFWPGPIRCMVLAKKGSQLWGRDCFDYIPILKGTVTVRSSLLPPWADTENLEGGGGKFVARIQPCFSIPITHQHPLKRHYVTKENKWKIQEENKGREAAQPPQNLPMFWKSKVNSFSGSILKVISIFHSMISNKEIE